ncbi:MAG: alpha/beta fold hydrolase [Giesbergeria sp.]|uniref:alpha/beta fold hydrolase n=1 Tax=Giesbergeria sp. TaxID=2818473 RepID=UPI0026030B49|nr:alpha/beta fold hydrolase [Giesbergeria sp.]MDD2610218.1 alpha/beta fold hydrolase [Giesbergeria sp.]
MKKMLPPLHHQTAGPADAPWITFIPGIGNDATFWQAQAQALTDEFRTLTFDPWGHAHSPQPPQDCGFQEVLDGIFALWDNLGIARSSVVGLGFGGSVGMALALAQPQRIDKVVACCCRPRQPDERRDFWRIRRELARTQGMEELVTATVDRWLSAEFRSAHPEVDTRLRAMMQRTSVEGYRSYVAAFIEMDFEARLEQLQVPTLLIAAEHDHGGGPVPDMQAMAARIPGAVLEVVKNSGHIVNHEQPDVVTAVLRSFFTAAV